LSQSNLTIETSETCETDEAFPAVAGPLDAFMKASIEVAPVNYIFSAAVCQLEQSPRGQEAGLHLSSETARLLFSKLTSTRLELLNVLCGTGARLP
jgi:hypothetical protein